jgi:excisionase family DNA binding protein
MITDETHYATVSEAARLLRVSVPTIWRWIDSGRLRAYRVGGRSIRIRTVDLASLVRPARTQQKMKERTMEDNVIHLGDRTADPGTLVEALQQGQARILARRRGKPLRPSAPLIRQARRERAAHL